MTKKAQKPGPVEDRESLWLLASGPTVWALHFLLCYGTVAVWCAKVAEADGPLGLARAAVAVYTVLALGAIAAIGVHGYRRHSYGDASVPHDYGTAADRHRLLGFATSLLAGLSFIATVFVGAAAAFIETCRLGGRPGRSRPAWRRWPPPGAAHCPGSPAAAFRRTRRCT